MTLDDALDACPLVAILRGVRPDEVTDHAAALFEAGFRVLEVPLNSPEPLDSVRRLAGAFGDRMIVGAGTVLTGDQVDAVAAAGGRLVVSPNADGRVIARAIQLGLHSAPGVATATEAFAAIDAGARTLKLFPASVYGPNHLRQLKAVLPTEVAVWAVGGVGPDSLAAWRDAGATAFGIGGDLYRPGQSPQTTAENANRLVVAGRALWR